MGHGFTKAERLQEMERLYFQRSYSDIEMAERLGVDRTTVFRDRTTLETEIPFIQDESGRYRIDRSHYLSQLRLNLNEALALYLASRRASMQSSMAQRHTASALEKLALALRQPMTSSLVQSADRILVQANQPERVKIIETVTRGWIESITVRIQYQGLRGRHPLPYTVKPYLIEPSPWSDSIYLIGESDGHHGMGVFKLDRIQSAVLTTEPFTVPEDFSEERLLRYAWGIWFEDKQPETVRLRFSPGAATKRLRETRWHPTETVQDLSDGSCIWEAQVSAWEEMLPWVRGWGADVEVLEPEKLRNLMRRETRRLAQLYKIETSNHIPLSFYLWAKVEEPSTHPLIYHMLDVGECALALWNFGLSEHTRKIFTQYLNLATEEAGRTLAFWASLHDIGKAAPGFQRKYLAAIPALKQVGYTFPEESPHPAPHGILTAWALPELLSQGTGLLPRDAKQLAFALAGHHGSWPTNDSLRPQVLHRSDKGEDLWDAARKELFLSLQEVYQPVKSVRLPEDTGALNAFLTLFSGLVSVADWIGSMEEHFPFLEDYQLPLQYANEVAAKQARSVLEQLGWVGWRADGSYLTFKHMFPDLTEPNLIQLKTFAAAERCELPALIMLEAPTGIGKTEAALYLADTWLQSQKGKGIYIAMPTQATSNQMYGRVVNFLESRYPAQGINAHLVHSGAIFEERRIDSPIIGIAQDQQAGADGVKAESWFLPRKRTLLAPFGVGTVDQALMSVLQTKHFFVRMFGLGQKIVIFDEVHAYDTYMSTLFHRLLRWLRSIETSVILLSATLPEKTRQEFVEAWLGEPTADVPDVEYPRLTLVTDKSVDVISLPAPEKHSLALDWVEPSPEDIANQLAEKTACGGCAAVICNRVKRAQDIYAAIKARGIVDDEHLILFHARFPFQWRKNIEDRVLAMFSKTGQRPAKAILVSTQVVEQSLDIDFDYLITDLAPVDLLLQRAGRLHRHPQNDALRPQRLNQPVIAITRSKIMNGLPDFGLDVYIYDKATLLRTWLTLRERDRIVLPEETSLLIEMVYGGLLEITGINPIFQTAMHEADEKARLERDREIHQANQRLVARPDYEDFLTARNEGLEEDDPKVNEAFRALTRLADPSVSLICLHQTPRGAAFDAGGTGAPIDVTQCPTLDQARELLRCAVSVQRRQVVNYFTNQVHLTPVWQQSALVRHHYPVVFDQHGICHPEGANFSLRLTHEFGLEVIEKEV
jgi:CRISPR-associated endonuclease/helicase Cas3